jgi:hypothetical protein
VDILLATRTILINFRCSGRADPLAAVAEFPFCQRIGSISSAVRKDSVSSGRNHADFDTNRARCGVAASPRWQLQWHTGRETIADERRSNRVV